MWYNIPSLKIRPYTRRGGLQGLSEKTNRSLVVVELTGGNGCLNTVVPYEDELNYDNRPTVHHKQDEVLKLNDRPSLSPQMGPIKRLWDDGNVAVLNFIGYPEPNRSHFRAMDIWHTAEPMKVIGDGWLGRAIRDLDPSSENVLTGLNLGRGPPSGERTFSGRRLKAMFQKWSMGRIRLLRGFVTQPR